MRPIHCTGGKNVKMPDMYDELINVLKIFYFLNFNSMKTILHKSKKSFRKSEFTR